MLSRLAAWTTRARHSALAIPVALVVAALIVGINEVAYHGAKSRLENLVERGKARVSLLQIELRTTEAESGKRGYILTSGSEYLQPYTQARSDVLRLLDELMQAYAGLGRVGFTGMVYRRDIGHQVRTRPPMRP